MTADEYVAEFAPTVSATDAPRLQTLLGAQELAQRMYNSYTFTGDDLGGRQPRYAIACAAAALAMTQQTTGRRVSDRLRSDLAVVTDNADQTGTTILHEVIDAYDIDLELAE
jgi:hypothetical protein